MTKGSKHSQVGELVYGRFVRLIKAAEVGASRVPSLNTSTHAAKDINVSQKPRSKIRFWGVRPEIYTSRKVAALLMMAM